jgi:uncharacterized protein YjbJ (UPF0337 family)
MGSTTDKMKGMANEAMGNLKQGAGKMMDDPELQAKGVVQERKGEGQQLKGDAKDATKKVVDRI